MRESEPRERMLDIDGRVGHALRSHASPLAAVVAAALDRLDSDELSDGERGWSARVEELRAELEASEEPLTVRYFGVGLADRGTGPDPREEREGRTIDGTVHEAARAGLPPLWSRLLLLLAHRQRPTTCLELGTCAGVSSACIAAALALNDHGRLVTLEGAETLAELARRNLAGLGLDRVEIHTGRFQDTLGPVLEERGPVDFAFLDGHHEEEATVRYFQLLREHLAPHAIVAFDDIALSAGMSRAWRRVSTDERVRIAVDLGRVGLCATGEPSEPRLSLRVEDRASPD